MKNKRKETNILVIPYIKPKNSKSGITLIALVITIALNCSVVAMVV